MKKTTPRGWLGWIGVALSVTACGATAPLGRMAPDLTRELQQGKAVQRVTVYLTAQGVVRGASIYHTDLKAIPAAVQALGAERFPGRTALYYETERYADGTRVYEIEYALDDGQKGELAARADGTLVYEERPVKTLPAAVQAAALARVPGQIAGREHQLGPGLDYYGVKIEHEGRLHVLLLKPDGRVVRHGVRVPAKLEIPYE